MQDMLHAHHDARSLAARSPTRAPIELPHFPNGAAAGCSIPARVRRAAGSPGSRTRAHRRSQW
eukprot:2256430-Prymnesium_polylepis.1